MLASSLMGLNVLSKLKNWFTDVYGTHPAPLQYMRLGPEGRDANPLMVSFYFLHLLTSNLILIPHSCNFLHGIAYILL